MIDIITKVKDFSVLEKTAKHFKNKGIILPTFRQMRNPEEIPQSIKDRLKNTGLWDLHPLNLFRITWKNEQKKIGGLFSGVNHITIPKELTGIRANIVVLTGKWFPTGAHKVGAAYGCLVPRIITGQFDPTYNKAVWPSTGNYCRGGAFDSYLMGCTAVAILPEEMSLERFEWLKEIGAEVIATPGCESNVKEIYDKCWEIRRTRKDCIIFNQFEEFGNPVWHYNVTGPAVEEVFLKLKNKSGTLSAFISNTGSAGTISAGDYLKVKYPNAKVIASEALQCPTLLMNGFGGHRIEGIGDKHVPWIHNVKNTDVVTAIDDEHCMRLFRLFNEAEGRKFLNNEFPGLKDFTAQLDVLGISGIANIISAIKTAKYYEMGEDDFILTIATDSAALYQSRLTELRHVHGAYTEIQSARDLDSCLHGISTDYMKELSYSDRKAIHNLKYFTWVEQQGKQLEDLNSLWYDKHLWNNQFAQAEKWDELINSFNQMTGL